MLTVHQVRLRHEDELMAIPEVVAVTEHENAEMPLIRVFITGRPQRARIPAVLDGYPVEVLIRRKRPF
ncbi:hypothetical protein [Amycolatopsis alkalitolerans]|uniref:Uncharacterized protein n=1 Tax=Amycolatopsis alkalitolerans TaxID=2547244 RepID=A0A5C4M6J5_9PSEU|nr:hypothetical protein [Amycolatopsis alkalitolerans]TNC26417.1 hypothetical protein FG385_11715 [Amycolatopsis alkalitolerans]